MRKIYYVLGLGALMFGILTGCDSDAQNEENSKETKQMETTQTETSTEETKNVNWGTNQQTYILISQIREVKRSIMTDMR